MAFTFEKPHFFYSFWGTLRVTGGQKGQKLPIFLKMICRSLTFGQRYNFELQTLYCHSFRTIHKFQLFLRHPRGQKGQKIDHFSKSNHPRSWKFAQRNNFSPEVWQRHSFKIKINFDPFWGTLGDKWGSKKVLKIVYSANNNPQKLQICTCR